MLAARRSSAPPPPRDAAARPAADVAAASGLASGYTLRMVTRTTSLGLLACALAAACGGTSQPGGPGATAPHITAAPQDATVTAGGTATFTVAASGTPPLAYRWRKGTAAVGGDAPTLVLSGVQASDAGDYAVTVSNGAGEVTSEPATLTVNPIAPVGDGSRYPSGRILSPITPTVAARLAALFARGTAASLEANVFVKAGDSITVNGWFLEQFAGPANGPGTQDWDAAYDLGSYGSLEGARAWFLQGRIGTDDPYARVSLAAQVGQDGAWALRATGTELSPLDQELQAGAPAYAVVMFGTNDFGSGGTDGEVYGLVAGTSFRILDRVIATGAVPILTSPPPSTWSAAALARSRMTSRLLRAVAQGRQVPFIDYYAALLDLPGYGLESDGVHPDALAYNRACFLTPQGLLHGFNVRNLVTLQTLDRVYRLLTLAGGAPDAETGGRTGAGTAADPYAIDALDFADHRAPAAGATGITYRLTVTGAGDTWAWAAAGHEGEAFGLELRDAQGAVIATAPGGTLTQALAAGTYDVRVTFGAGVADVVFASVAASAR